MANSLDKFRKGVAQWSGNIGSAGVSDAIVKTVPLASSSNLPTDTAVMITVNRVDANGKKTGNYEGIVGVISGSIVIDCIRGVEGTAQAWTGGTVVEVLHTAANVNDLIDGILVEHNQDGKHTSALITTLKASGSDVNTGTNDTKIVTPKAISDSWINNGYNSLYRQAIINGNFDVWQRGTSSTEKSAGFMVADRWLEVLSADSGTLPTTVTSSRQLLTSGDIPNSFYHYRIAVDGAGTSLGNSSVCRLNQTIEHGTRMLAGDGKKVTISFWARASVANKRMGYGLVQTYGTGGSPSSAETITGQIITLTSTWTKYTYTFTTNTLSGKTFGTDNNDYLRPTFLFQWGTTTATSYFGGGTAESYGGAGTIDLAQVQLCAGDVALPFMPKSFEEELRACQRYYEVGNYRYRLLDNGGIVSVSLPFKVNKRIAITPSNATVTGTNVVIDAGQNVTDSLNITLPATSGIIDRNGVWTANAEL